MSTTLKNVAVKCRPYGRVSPSMPTQARLLLPSPACVPHPFRHPRTVLLPGRLRRLADEPAMPGRARRTCDTTGGVQWSTSI